VARADGNLSHDLLPGEKAPRDACGVFGVWAPDEDVAKLTYYGLYALQHRGQEAAGIAVSDGDAIVVFKDLGLVSQVFDESTLASLHGHLAIGHCRYSTTGSPTWENAQPTFRANRDGAGLALGHNGNLVNTDDLARGRAGGDSVDDLLGSTTDSDLMTALLVERIGRPMPPGAAPSGGMNGASGSAGTADSTDSVSSISPVGSDGPDGMAGQEELFALDPPIRAMSVEDAAMEVLPALRGAFCLVFMDSETLYAARDPHGVHPLVLGRLDRGWVVASETAALDIVGASFVREIEPGELLAIDRDGPRSRRFAAPDPKGCLFEYLYLARPDTTISGRSVYGARVEIGRRLAREQPAEADLVIPVPESGIPAAIGYAEESAIPFRQGFVKNSYVGRTFIQPSQTIRQLGIRLKLNPLREVIRGKRVVVVDDSIVRGNTQRAQVRMLREAGAVEVHVRISSPPVTWPCFYGIDFASRAELIAAGLDIEGIRASIGADSLGYVSLEALVAATEQPAARLCAACFDGKYPIPLPEVVGKDVLERDGAPGAVRTGGSGVVGNGASGVVGNGAPGAALAVAVSGGR
jgi:amidophosphoribosyltransferase